MEAKLKELGLKKTGKKEVLIATALAFLFSLSNAIPMCTGVCV
jgi:hypothetical protein